MSTFTKDVLLEALSALTGVTLKNDTDIRQKPFHNELNILNLIPIAVNVKGLGANYSTLEAQSVHVSLDDFDDFAAGSNKKVFVNLDEFLDPRFDFDYRNTEDLSLERGGELYKRPCGWYRYALKVLDKYPDGNEWLGTAGWRSHSVAGEWPVSYHGTSIEGAIGIVTSDYKAGPRQLYGRGIYSTYDIDQASGYSKEFKSKTNGKTYRVLLQNRINPQMRKVCDRKDYWLIQIPEGTSPEKEREIVEKSIRPYGILLKQV